MPVPPELVTPPFSALLTAERRWTLATFPSRLAQCLVHRTVDHLLKHPLLEEPYELPTPTLQPSYRIPWPPSRAATLQLPCYPAHGSAFRLWPLSLAKA